MTERRDPDKLWAATHSPVHPLKLHALGAMTVYWNRCEMALFLIFAGVTKIDGNLAFALSHEMGDITMCNRIRESLEIVDHGDDVKDLVRHTLRLYDINRLNRNQLTHFRPAPGESGKIEFWRQKGPKLELKTFPNELSDIQRVVEDLETLSTHLTEFGQYFLRKPYGEIRRSLPEKPPLPELLWKPPAQTEPKPKSQPKASQG